MHVDGALVAPKSGAKIQNFQHMQLFLLKFSQNFNIYLGGVAAALLGGGAQAPTPNKQQTNGAAPTHGGGGSDERLWAGGRRGGAAAPRVTPDGGEGDGEGAERRRRGNQEGAKRVRRGGAPAERGGTPRPPRPTPAAAAQRTNGRPSRRRGERNADRPTTERPRPPTQTARAHTAPGQRSGKRSEGGAEPEGRRGDRGNAPAARNRGGNQRRRGREAGRRMPPRVSGQSLLAPCGRRTQNCRRSGNERRTSVASGATSGGGWRARILAPAITPQIVPEPLTHQTRLRSPPRGAERSGAPKGCSPRGGA